MTELPAPLVPPEVDLRGIVDWMPLMGDRLFGSETWIESSNDGRVAQLRLWWQAFAKEKPAGSLPDSDRLLAVYAGYGEVVKAWKKIKAEALRGFVLCSDGRWYHRVVAELALDAWHRRQDKNDANSARAERQRRWRERIKALASALRAAGQTPPRGASLEKLEEMARDAGVDVPAGNVDVYTGEGDVYRDVTTASAEIGNTVHDSTGQDSREDSAAVAARAGDGQAGDRERPPPDPPPPKSRTAGKPEDQAFTLWQAAAAQHGWPEAGYLTPTRRIRLGPILTACGGVPGFEAALERATTAEFLHDQAGHIHGWFDFDWLLDEQHFARLMEGRYDQRHAPTRRHDRKQHGGPEDDSVAAGIRESLARRSVLAGG